MSYYGGATKDGPACAKIWDYLSSIDSEYADNITDICARDTMSDNLGLTVIYPDAKFRKAFKDNIHGSGEGNASTARRMLMNTIVKRHLDTAEAWGAFNTSLPLRSGLTLPVTKIDGNKVVLQNTIVIEQDTKFKSPGGFKYSVWKVVDGEYPTSTNFPLGFARRKRGKKSGTSVEGGWGDDTLTSFSGGDNENWNGQENMYDGESEGRMTIGGGGRDIYLMKVGRLMMDSPDTLRVSIVASLLNEYKQQLLRDRCARYHPLLNKAASLYNWLSMYRPEVLEVVLPITDVHPGVNLMMLILDPQSPITIEILMGSGNDTDPVPVAQGWKGAEVTIDPYKEWEGYLEKAAASIPSDDYLGAIQQFRNNVVTSTGLDYAAAGNMVANLYEQFSQTGQVLGVQIVPRKTVETLYAGARNKDRKMWQDQMRFVATCAFSGTCDTHIISSSDLDEELSQAVRFRPRQGYTNACTFTTLTGQYSAKDDYYAFLKWLFSTDIMYVPQALKSRLCSSTAAPFDGLEYGKVSRRSILNNHYIKAQMIKGMESAPPSQAPLLYGIEWIQKSRGAQPSSLAKPAAVTPSGVTTTPPPNVPVLPKGGMDPNVGSYQGIGYQMGSSNDFIYGENQGPGVIAERGMYGNTFGPTNEVPYENWNPSGGSSRPSSRYNANHSQSLTDRPGDIQSEASGGMLTNLSIE